MALIPTFEIATLEAICSVLGRATWGGAPSTTIDVRVSTKYSLSQV
jgi:hypothetical protein